LFVIAGFPAVKLENMDFRQDFIEFALSCKVLRFGEFKTKAGRLSPYFSMPACSTTVIHWPPR
jgi:hypothetical protein